MTITADPILLARRIHTYYGASHILHAIDFSVSAGEAVGLMGRGARGGGLSSASFTRSRRPRSSKASNRRMASAARAGSLNCANANPRALPVTRSVPSRTRTCGSTSVKALRSSSSVVSKDKLPIKTVDEMVSSSLGRFFDASSLPRVLRPLKPGTVPHQMRDPRPARGLATRHLGDTTPTAARS